MGCSRVAKDGFPRRWNVVLVWAGLRGAVALAAALSLPLGLPDRDLLLTLTLGIVLFTLIAQGLTMRPLLDLVRHRAQRYRAARDRSGGGALAGDAGGGAGGRGAAGDRRRLEPVVAERLIAGYAARREEIRQALTTAYGESEPFERQEERAAARHLLQVQREAARQPRRRDRSPKTRWAFCSKRLIRIWRGSRKRSKPMEKGRENGPASAVTRVASLRCACR